MILEVTRAARRLDHLLHARFGAPYRVLLTIGLIGEIVRNLAEFPERFQGRKPAAAVVFDLLVPAALLISQLSEFNRRAARRRRRARHQKHVSKTD